MVNTLHRRSLRALRLRITIGHTVHLHCRWRMPSPDTSSNCGSDQIDKASKPCRPGLRKIIPAQTQGDFSAADCKAQPSPFSGLGRKSPVSMTRPPNQGGCFHFVGPSNRRQPSSLLSCIFPFFIALLLLSSCVVWPRRKPMAGADSPPSAIQPISGEFEKSRSIAGGAGGRMDTWKGDG